MHLSGILVFTDPLRVTDCMRELEALPGVETHFCYPESGRIIVVQENESTEAQQRGLRRIQELSSVRMAALIEHRIDSPEAADRSLYNEEPPRSPS